MNPRALLLGLLIASTSALAGPTVDEQKLMDLEKSWGEVFIKGDVTALGNLFAEEYLFTDHDGQTYTRDDELSSVKSGDQKMTAYRVEDLKVHVYKDFATVTGLVDYTATYKGEDGSCRCRFTDVYVKRAGRWQAIASHVSKVIAH